MNKETSFLDVYWVYIIKTRKGKLYTGITTDLKRRFKEHSTNSKRAKYFNSDSPLKIVYKEGHSSRSSALKREWQIKCLNRSQKELLITENVAV